MITKNDIVANDVVVIEDPRTQNGELPYQHLEALRSWRGNYGVPKRNGNMVIKGFFAADTQTLIDLLELHAEYQAELSRHMPVLSCDPYIQDGVFHLEQPYVSGITFEQILQNADYPDPEKSRMFYEILKMTIRTIKQSNKPIGIDAKPENYMSCRDRLMLIDTFPPFLSDSRFRKIFNIRECEQDFATRPDYSFFRNPRKVARRFWLKSDKLYHLDYHSLTARVMQEEDPENMKFFERLSSSWK